ncbi:phosphoribosyltransferase [bacterium]|nr:phosphoribosyltransferase [bacterium]
MKSYDYANRHGVEELSWETFASLSRGLAEQIADLRIDTVVGIARAGLLPATAVACSLRCEMYPVRVTRRVDDEVTNDHPVWRVGVSPDVRGRRLAVIDVLADSGETLLLVAQEVSSLGAEKAVTVALVSHSWASPMPDVCGLVSDALVVFPWDRHVLLGGEWGMHPELKEALRLQEDS